MKCSDSPETKLAIPRFGESVAPCFEFSATIAIFRVAGGQVTDQIDFTLLSKSSLDRVRLLKDQGVNVLICGGIQDRFEDLVRASRIQVISRVRGNVEDLLAAFIQGRLTPGRQRQEVLDP